MTQPEIRLLTPQVAECIAAGEIIERPSSVVKELVENAIDAQATEIAIHLEEGGKNLIEILDNGIGMSPDNLTLCRQKHATSKLRSLEDLERIHTLGFRGEALGSIATVAQLRIISRCPDGDTAYELRPLEVYPNKITFGHFLHSSHGTCIQVSQLFSTLPARLKFLKSQASEVNHVREWIERLALAHPHIGFHLTSDSKTLLQLKATDEQSRIQAVLLDEQDYPCSSILHPPFRIYWLSGWSGPTTRKLTYIVNQRPIKDRLLQQALLQPFRQILMPGHFPAVVLYLDIPPTEIDINVHPSKTEIRFLHPQQFFFKLDQLIKEKIHSQGHQKVAFPELFKIRPEPTYTPLETTPFFFPKERPEPMPLKIEQISMTPAQPQKRFVGHLFQTYLLFEQATEFLLMDQHAADERIRYERLKNRFLHNPSPLAQALLIPEIISIKHSSISEKKLHWMNTLGFEVELFGESSLVFRAIPAEWGLHNLPIRLTNLMERIESYSSETFLMDEALFETLASEACHSAVRAKEKLQPGAAEFLLEQLLQCQHPWNCPHGRPTLIQVPEKKFEEWFLRKF